MNVTFTTIDQGLLLFFIAVGVVAIFLFLSYRDVLRN